MAILNIGYTNRGNYKKIYHDFIDIDIEGNSSYEHNIGRGNNMNLLKAMFRVIGIIAKILFKFSCFMLVMLAGAYLFAPMGIINSKNIDLSSFSNTPNDTMMLLFNSEYFSGYLFSVTIALVVFIAYILWDLHEIALHKAKEKKSSHIQLVFALSLCGLFIHKVWWVLAIIIAFANWEQLGASISNILRNSRSNTKPTNEVEAAGNNPIKTEIKS